MKSKPRIAFLGDLTADVYMPQKEIHLGGAALNMALWARKLGAEPTIFSAVGTDAVGKKFLRTESIQKKRGRTSSIEIFVSENGERRYGTWNPGVLAGYHLRPKDKKLLCTLDALIVTVYPQYVHILQELKNAPFTIINYGDLHEFQDDLRVVEDNLAVADALIFGLDKDADESRINAIRRMAYESKKLTIVTLGKYGSVAWCKGQSYVQPAQEVPVVDTTGAGDAFLAAFLVSFLKTKDIQKSLEEGSTTAARVIQKVGVY